MQATIFRIYPSNFKLWQRINNQAIQTSCNANMIRRQRTYGQLWVARSLNHDFPNAFRRISWMMSILHEILLAWCVLLTPTDKTGVFRPEWFEAFLADRGTRKPSMHTMKAYRQDFDAIAAMITDDKQDASPMPLGDIMTEAMRSVFARYAETLPQALAGYRVVRG